MECMYCHKQHELNSLRAKLHRFENGKEFKDLSDSLDKMKSRAEFLQQMSQANREKRIHAEEEAKEAKSACRKLEKENARLTKEIDWLKEDAANNIARAVVYAERQKNVELARRMRDLEAQKDEECRAAVKAECEKKQAEIDTLKDQVVQLERKLIELQITLKQEPVPPHRPVADGTNSGTPTSQTPIGKKKVIPYTERGKGLKKGGQPGHTPYFGTKFDDNDPDVHVKTKESPVRICPCCGKPMVLKRFIDKDVLGFEVKVVKTRLRYEVLGCEDCKEEYHDEIPERLAGNGIHYDPEVEALIILLNEVNNVPMRDTAEIIEALSKGDITPAASFVAKLAIRAGELLAPFVADLHLLSLASPDLFWDDTVAFVNTHRACLRFYGNETFSLYRGHWTKSRETIDDDYILALLDRDTAVMHDHCSVSYNPDFYFANLDCIAHLIRALAYLDDLTHHSWTKDMISLIRTAIHDRHILISENKWTFSDEYLTNFWKKYKEILSVADKEYDDDVAKKAYFASDEGAVIVRMRNYAVNYFAWLVCFDFPTTDNLSERALRVLKTKLHVSGQFCTLDALQDYAAIMSYVETCKKNNINIYSALVRLMNRNPYTLDEIISDKNKGLIAAYKLKMQNTNEVLSREMSSDIVANPQLSRILDLENGLTADERQQLIYSYLSTSRPRNEMVLLLSARGDIKHLFINRTKEKTKENKSANTATTTGTSNEKGMPTANGATNGTGMPAANGAASGTGMPVADGAASGTGMPAAKGAASGTGMPVADGAANGTGMPVSDGATNGTHMPAVNGATNGTGMSSSTKEESGETGQPDSSEDFADILDEQKRQAAVQNARAELLHDEDAFERASDTADSSGKGAKHISSDSPDGDSQNKSCESKGASSKKKAKAAEEPIRRKAKKQRGRPRKEVTEPEQKADASGSSR